MKGMKVYEPAVQTACRPQDDHRRRLGRGVACNFAQLTEPFFEENQFLMKIGLSPMALSMTMMKHYFHMEILPIYQI
jgi:hypothetical protein